MRDQQQRQDHDHDEQLNEREAPLGRCDQVTTRVRLHALLGNHGRYSVEEGACRRIKVLEISQMAIQCQ